MEESWWAYTGLDAAALISRSTDSHFKLLSILSSANQLNVHILSPSEQLCSLHFVQFPVSKNSGEALLISTQNSAHIIG